MGHWGLTAVRLSGNCSPPPGTGWPKVKPAEQLPVSSWCRGTKPCFTWGPSAGPSQLQTLLRRDLRLPQLPYAGLVFCSARSCVSPILAGVLLGSLLQLPWPLYLRVCSQETHCRTYTHELALQGCDSAEGSKKITLFRVEMIQWAYVIYCGYFW